VNGMIEYPVPIELLRTVTASQPYPLVFATVSGAHLYGFASADSDFDLRGVHCLPLRLLVGLIPGEETIEVSRIQDGLELDLVTHDAAKFFRLLLRPNGYVLEQVLSPLIVYRTPWHDRLIDIAPACFTKHHAHHYLGFARNQWTLLSKESPPRIKPLLYLYRVLLTGIHLMKSGELEANLRTLNALYPLPYLSELIARKVDGSEHETLTMAHLDFHQREYQRLMAELESAQGESPLPEEPAAHDALHALLLEIRGVR
jgi:uncharacterized protein